MKVYSPLLEKESECNLIRQISTQKIREAYVKNFNYDPKLEFKDIDVISLYECKESGLRFFTPLTTAGHEALYQQLQTFDWNYKEKKWEHDQSLEFIKPDSKVLDVGCGQAAFLTRALNEKSATSTGLEFNDSAAEFGRKRGIEVFTESIEKHAELRQDHYDYVTSFQVLEHVTEPASFLRSCLKTLKPGGELIIGVPNNDSFLGLLDENWLNMPPHHMSLWSRHTLENLAKQLSVRHIGTYIESLQEKDWFQAAFENMFFGKNTFKRRLYYKLGFDGLFKQYVEKSWKTIPGHTIMVRFVKD